MKVTDTVWPTENCVLTHYPTERLPAVLVSPHLILSTYVASEEETEIICMPILEKHFIIYADVHKECPSKDRAPLGCVLFNSIF